MKIIDKVKETKKRQDFYKRFHEYIKVKWKGKVGHEFSETINLSIKKYFFNVRVVKIYIDYDNKEIEVNVIKKYENHNDLKNILKEYEGKEKGVKITLNIGEYIYS